MCFLLTVFDLFVFAADCVVFRTVIQLVIFLLMVVVSSMDNRVIDVNNFGVHSDDDDEVAVCFSISTLTFTCFT